MSLLADTRLFNAVQIIDGSILKQIEDDLDTDEKISVLFLITQNHCDAFAEIFDLFQRTNAPDTYVITRYVHSHPDNWEERVLEALCVLNNREVLRKLPVATGDLDLRYFPRIRLCSKSISAVAKCLYALCESLDETNEKLLLNCVKTEIVNYDSALENVEYLELHMLYWMHMKYITISKNGKHNLRKLLKHLNKINGLQIICTDLEKCENQLHVVDTHRTLLINDKSYLPSVSLEEPSLSAEKQDYRKKIRLVNNGLCIIINQMYFGKEYEARFGTTSDCASLSETFRVFGFKVCVHNNFNKREMLEEIRNIPKEHGNHYDCLFLCVLSHGYRGGIIASDEKEVSLEAIERAVCCIELKDVMKIVIIQACQGETRGSINNNCLTTDGLCDPSSSSISDIRPFANFFMFMSTMQGFVSIRHKEQGSWFIQEMCRIFRTYGDRLTFFECVREIMACMRKKRGRIEGSHIVQLSEIRQDRLDSDFHFKSVTVDSV